MLVNGAFFVPSGEGLEGTIYEKASSIDPKSAALVDTLTQNAGVLGEPRYPPNFSQLLSVTPSFPKYLGRSPREEFPAAAPSFPLLPALLSFGSCLGCLKFRAGGTVQNYNSSVEFS